MSRRVPASTRKAPGQVMTAAHPSPLRASEQGEHHILDLPHRLCGIPDKGKSKHQRGTRTTVRCLRISAAIALPGKPASMCAAAAFTS
jgi:hypothetical protein